MHPPVLVLPRLIQHGYILTGPAVGYQRHVGVDSYPLTVANPAELLLAQLRPWNQPNRTAYQTRNPDADKWATQRLAVRHLDAIDQLLTELSETRNVAVYQRHFSSWAADVFAYPQGWNAAGSAQVDMAALEHLENLAEFLRSYVPELKPTGEAELRGYVKLVQSTVEEDQSIPADLRIHLREVVSHLLRCLDEYETVGAFELQKALENLAATVLRTAANSGNKSKWKPTMDGFVWPFAVSVMSALPSAALAQLLPGMS